MTALEIPANAVPLGAVPPLGEIVAVPDKGGWTLKYYAPCFGWRRVYSRSCYRTAPVGGTLKDCRRWVEGARG